MTRTAATPVLAGSNLDDALDAATAELHETTISNLHGAALVLMALLTDAYGADAADVYVVMVDTDEDHRYAARWVAAGTPVPAAMIPAPPL